MGVLEYTPLLLHSPDRDPSLFDLFSCNNGKGVILKFPISIVIWKNESVILDSLKIRENVRFQ